MGDLLIAGALVAAVLVVVGLVSAPGRDAPRDEL